MFYDVLLAGLVWEDSIDNSYESEISDLGDTVKISTLPEFSAAQELAEGTRLDADAITATQQSLVINSRVAKDVVITNKGRLQSIEFMTKLQELVVFSIMKKMQSLLIAATVPSASAPDHQIAYDSGSTLALADILEGKELLDTQDVPQGDRCIVMGAAQLNDLFNITGFTSSEFITSGAPVVSGELPQALLGFKPKHTTEAGAVTYLFHRSYMTMAVQQSLNLQQYDLGVDGKRSMRLNADILWGYKQLDDKRVVTIS